MTSSSPRPRRGDRARPPGRRRVHAGHRYRQRSAGSGSGLAPGPPARLHLRHRGRASARCRQGHAGNFAALEALAADAKVLAIGEIGLDYHYDFSPRDVQRDVFIAQLQLAARAAKPIVIHTREAWDDTLLLLREHWSGGGIMHCFSGGPAEARQALDLGFYLSFGGVLTFPKAEALREARASRPKIACWWRPTRPISPRSPSAANATSRPSWWRPRAGWPKSAARRPSASPRRPLRTSNGCCWTVTSNEPGQARASHHRQGDLRPDRRRSGARGKEDQPEPVASVEVVTEIGQYLQESGGKVAAIAAVLASKLIGPPSR